MWDGDLAPTDNCINIKQSDKAVVQQVDCEVCKWGV